MYPNIITICPLGNVVFQECLKMLCYVLDIQKSTVIPLSSLQKFSPHLLLPTLSSILYHCAQIVTFPCPQCVQTINSFLFQLFENLLLPFLDKGFLLKILKKSAPSIFGKAQDFLFWKKLKKTPFKARDIEVWMLTNLHSLKQCAITAANIRIMVKMEIVEIKYLLIEDSYLH